MATPTRPKFVDIVEMAKNSQEHLIISELLVYNLLYRIGIGPKVEFLVVDGLSMESLLLQKKSKENQNILILHISKRFS